VAAPWQQKRAPREGYRRAEVAGVAGAGRDGEVARVDVLHEGRRPRRGDVVDDDGALALEADEGELAAEQAGDDDALRLRALVVAAVVERRPRWR
jgi:hypothetical protein